MLLRAKMRFTSEYLGISYVAIVRGEGLFGADAVYRGNANVFAPLHLAMLQLYSLQ